MNSRINIGRFMQVPEYTWELIIANHLHIYLEENKVPNWFWRSTQELIFGFKYRRLKK